MGVNPGERFPKPTVKQQAVTHVKVATRGTIFYFMPILDGMLILFAVAAMLAGIPLLALAVAYAAGRIGVR